VSAVTESLKKAVQHHQAGELQQAERLYRRILRRDRSHADALHLLGVVAHQQQRNTDAVNYFSRAIAADAKRAPFYSNLSAAQMSLGEVDRAAENARAAVEIAPEYAGAWYNLGTALQSQGHLEQAAEALERAIRHAPGFAEALTNLGNLRMAQGRLDDAIGHFREVVNIQPGNAQLRYNLANALNKSGQTEAAVAAYEETLQLDPNFAEAHNNLATVHKLREDYEAAEQSFCKAIELRPDYVEAQGNLGATLLLLGRFDEAARQIESALKLAPDNAELHYGLGKVFQSQKRDAEALACYRRALDINRQHARALFGSGALLSQSGRLAEARDAYRTGLQFEGQHPSAWIALGKLHALEGDSAQALSCCRTAAELAPDGVEAHFQLGNVHLSLGELDEAKAAFERVVGLKHDHASGWNNLGNVHAAQARASEAVACYRRALEIEPSFAEAHSNSAELLRNVGQLDLAAEHYERGFDSALGRRLRVLHATMLPPVYESHEDMLAWRGRFIEKLDNLLEDGVTLDPAKELAPNFFYLAYQGFQDRELLERASQLYRSSYSFRPRTRTRGDKIRVGFASQHFRNHTIGSFTAGLIANLPRDEFDVSVLTHVRHSDPMGQFIEKSCDQYVVLSQRVPTAVERIEQLQLDVLFYADVGMDPLIYSLACSRLAPVQCVTWGHPITTGLETIDYFLSSDLLETAGAQQHYTEKLVQLETLPTHYYRPKQSGPARGREQFGLADHDRVYLCPQSLFKLHPDFDEVLDEILNRDDRAVIVMVGGIHKHWTELVQKRFQRSIAGSERIRFIARLEHDDFLSLLSVADVMLDPLHFGGGNTSYQGLALGVPIVTLPSPYMRGRVTSALCQKIGVTDCIADTKSQYVETALRLAADRDFRDDVCCRIRATNDVLFEDGAAVRQISDLFQQAIHSHPHST